MRCGNRSLLPEGQGLIKGRGDDSVEFFEVVLMNGLLGWTSCAANVDAAKILDSMVQAAHVETALNISASSSPASFAASQTHDPVSVHSAGSIIAALLATMFWLYRRKADLPAFLLVTRIVYIWAVYFNNYAVRHVYFTGLLLLTTGMAMRLGTRDASKA